MKHPQKMRRADERCARELRRLAERIARKEKTNPKDVLYELTGKWEPIKTHEWDEF